MAGSFSAHDSRHNLRPGTTLRRGAARRVCQRVLTRPGKGRYCLSPFTAPDSRHNLRPGTTLRRGAARRVCQRVLTRPGKGRYCLSPFTAPDSRHNLRPGTTLSRGAAGRVCAGLMPVQPSPPVGRSAAAAAPGKRSAVKEAPPRISLASVPPMSPL